MNGMLASGPLAQATGWALLHLLWQGALVAVALAVVLKLLARHSANVRYAASCAALVLVVVLGITTGVRSYESGLDAAAFVPAAPAESPLAPAQGIRSFVTSAPAAIAPARMQDFVRAASDFLPFLVTLWLFGVSMFSVRLILEWLRARRLVSRTSVPAREPWPATAQRLGEALGLRRAVRLLESTLIEVPSVIGLMRPVILVPTSALTGLTPAQLEMILAHELAHIRRHDFLVNLLQSAVETLLFYHPAVWWISRRVREERENCCDDLAVAVCGNPVQYARALTRLEELRGDVAPSVAMSANGGSLLERIRRIALGAPSSTGPTARGIVALTVFVSAIGGLIAIALPAIGERAENAKATAADEIALTPRTTPGSADTSWVFAPLSELAPLAPLAPPDPRHEVSTPDGVEVLDEEEPTIDDMIALKVQGVSFETIAAMRALLPGIRLQEIATLAAVGVTPEYIKAMRWQGLEIESADAATSLVALGVTPAFLDSVRAAGLVVKTAEDASGLKAVGVTGPYVRELRAAGVRVSDAEDAQSLAALGVTPDWVREMKRAGVDFADTDELQSLKALGVTPEFAGRVKRAGYTPSAELLTKLGAAGLTNGSFVEEMSQYRSR